MGLEIYIAVNYIICEECGNPIKPKGAPMNNENYFSNFSNEQILSHPDVKQRTLMMTGKSKDKTLELTKEQEKQIAIAYSKMFYALTTIHWCKGATLGTAWQKALEQMSSFVKTKSNPAHPMNKYLHALDNQYRREISERIMTSPYSNEKINMNPELAKKWSDTSTKQFQSYLKKMNDMYKEYMPQKEVNNNQSAQETNKAYTIMMKLLQLQNEGYQHAA